MKKIGFGLLKMVTRIIANGLDRCKSKHPLLYVGIVGSATVLQFGGLDLILGATGVTLNSTITSMILWLLVAITSPRTTAFTSDGARKERVIQKSKQASKEMAVEPVSK